MGLRYDGSSVSVRPTLAGACALLHERRNRTSCQPARREVARGGVAGVAVRRCERGHRARRAGRCGRRRCSLCSGTGHEPSAASAASNWCRGATFASPNCCCCCCCCCCPIHSKITHQPVSMRSATHLCNNLRCVVPCAPAATAIAMSGMKFAFTAKLYNNAIPPRTGLGRRGRTRVRPPVLGVSIERISHRLPRAGLCCRYKVHATKLCSSSHGSRLISLAG